MNSGDLKVCAACGAKNDPLKKCTGCRLVHYCGRECQVADRKAHKTFCKEQERKLKGDAAMAQKAGIDEDDLDKPLIVFFVGRVVDSLMVPLLGSQNPVFWDILFHKKGAKERVNAHMLIFAINYLSRHPEYNSDAAKKKLLEADYHRDTPKEPFLSEMQKELWEYLKEVEHFFGDE
jgi:hypothetical protein